MTATYDPTDPKYFDPAALREELDRVFDLCHGCRLCFNLCPSFPTLFDFIDANDGDVSALTDGEHDQVVDECYQCKLCYVKCPYVPPHEWELDFPRLMSRVHAVRQKQLVGVKERADRPVPGPHRCPRAGLGRGGAGGQLGHRHARAPGRAGSWRRRSAWPSERLLPPYAKQRFTTWFKRRRGRAAARRDGARSSVSPPASSSTWSPTSAGPSWRSTSTTGWRAALPEGTKCCGAPVAALGPRGASSTKAARRNVAALAAEVRAGRDVVVAQPTCAYVVKRDYPIYAKGADADLVAAHTYDPAEYLMRAPPRRRRRLQPARRVPRPSPTARCPTR